MESTADIIANKLLSLQMAKVINLDKYKKEKEFIQDTSEKHLALKDIIDQSYDISHAAYIFMINFSSILSDIILQFKETKKILTIAQSATDMYLPEGPPISPLTNSYFSLWLMFDVLFGKSKDTIGTCVIAFAKKARLPTWMSDALIFLQTSRIGIYTHCGFNGDFIKLRELGQQDVYNCHVPVNYKGKPGEIWLVRIAPALYLKEDYFIVLTTPYVIQGHSEDDFNSYYSRELAHARKNKRKLSESDFYYNFFKYGPNLMHWNEYIFQAYLTHMTDAIFLTGIPDIKTSLPHSS